MYSLCFRIWFSFLIPSLLFFLFSSNSFLILLYPEFVYTYVWRDFNVLPTCGPPTRHTNIIASNVLRSDAHGARLSSLSLTKIPQVLLCIPPHTWLPVPSTLLYRNVDWKLIWRNWRQSCHFLSKQFFSLISKKKRKINK